MQKTAKQILGDFGEIQVAKKCSCWSCGRKRTYKLLPKNFKCADLICDFCGALSQVKAKSVQDIDIVPNEILGAAWGPQKERMEEGIYFSLYLVLKNDNRFSIWFLSKDNQNRDLFVPRKPLSENARRAGWQGFMYKIQDIKSQLIRLA